MSDLNQVILDGRLVKAAELSYFADQTAYCNFTIGNNETWKKQDGTYESIGSFFDCSMKGQYAQTMAQYLQKGQAVTVVGRLKQQKWEKDGQKYSRVIVKVDLIKLRNSSQNNNGQSDQGYQQQTAAIPGQTYQQQNYQSQVASAVPPMPDEYIPFGDGNELNEDIPF